MRRILSFCLLFLPLSPAWAAPPPSAGDETEPFDRADLSWVLAVSGVVAAAAGGAMWVFGYGEQLQLERALVAGPGQAQAERDARTWSAAGGAAIGLGVTLLASGVLLRAFDDEGHLLAGASPTPGGGAVTVGLRF